MLEGAGRSTSASFAIFRRGCVLRRLAIDRVFVVEITTMVFQAIGPG